MVVSAWPRGPGHWVRLPIISGIVDTRDLNRPICGMPSGPQSQASSESLGLDMLVACLEVFLA